MIFFHSSKVKLKGFLFFTNIEEAMAQKTIEVKQKRIKFWAKKTCEDQGWKKIDEGGKQKEKG